MSVSSQKERQVIVYMADNQAQLLTEFEKIMDCFLNGKPILPVNEELIRLECGDAFSDKLLLLIHHAEEIRIFTCHLSHGDIDCETPKRENKMAGPLKQLHMQLCNLAFSLE